MANRLISALSDLTPQEHKTQTNYSSSQPLDFFKVKNADIDFDISVGRNIRLVRFENCRFLKPVIFENLEVSLYFDFINCEFHNEVVFKDLKVIGKSRFLESKFKKKAEFNNVSFKDLADFFKVTFNQLIIFYKVDFFSTTVFTETTFKKNALFTHAKIADVIIFTRTKFNAGLDLSQSVITGQVNIHNSDLLNFPDEPDISDNDVYRNAIENSGKITRNNKRETFRVLKKFAKDDHNQFKYLEYSKLENEVYFKQLKSVWFKRFNSFTIFLLNKVSNNHNMSWLQGVLFTGTVGFLFFYLSLVNTSSTEIAWAIPNYETFTQNTGMYFNFLSPLHTSDLFLAYMPSTATIILDFFGRIFVGYGIYQTVQAFRKHKG